MNTRLENAYIRLYLAKIDSGLPMDVRKKITEYLCDHYNSLFRREEIPEGTADAGTGVGERRGPMYGYTSYNITCCKCMGVAEQRGSAYSSLYEQYRKQPSHLDKENEEKWVLAMHKRAAKKKAEEEKALAARPPEVKIAELEEKIRKNLLPLYQWHQESIDKEIRRYQAEIDKIRKEEM